MTDDDYLDLIKEQNRAICSLRHMMQRGYSLYFVSDFNEFKVKMHGGQWAVVKHPVPGDNTDGFRLYPSFDEAYHAAMSFTWQDAKFEPSQSVNELAKAHRTIKTKEKKSGNGKAAN